MKYFAFCLLFVELSLAEIQIWTSMAGTKIEAEFVELKDEKCSLKRKDGKLLQFPLAQLAAADQKKIRLLSRQKNPPFLAIGPDVWSAKDYLKTLRILVSEERWEVDVELGVNLKKDAERQSNGNWIDPEELKAYFAGLKITTSKKFLVMSMGIVGSAASSRKASFAQFEAIAKTCEEHGFVLMILAPTNYMNAFDTFGRPINELSTRLQRIEGLVSLNILELQQVLSGVLPIKNRWKAEDECENILVAGAIYSVVAGEAPDFISYKMSAGVGMDRKKVGMIGSLEWSKLPSSAVKEISEKLFSRVERLR